MLEKPKNQAQSSLFFSLESTLTTNIRCLFYPRSGLGFVREIVFALILCRQRSSGKIYQVDGRFVDIETRRRYLG